MKKKYSEIIKNKRQHFTCLVSLTLCLISFHLAAQPVNGLMAHYKLNGDGIDATGRGNNGTVNGLVVATTDRFGNANSAMTFSGGYIDAGNPPDLQLTTSISIAAWINPTTIPGWSAIVNKWSGLNSGYYLGVNPAGSVIKWNQASANLEGNAISTGVWTHVAATFDGNTIRIYENGVQTDFINSNTPLANTATSFMIGIQSNTLTSAFDGAIDDVLVYDRALTPLEISDLFNGSTVGLDEKSFGKTINLYPNPTTANVNLNFGETSNGSSVIISDITGKQVYRLDNINKQILNLDINHFSKGLYFVTIQNNKQQKVIKLMKQ